MRINFECRILNLIGPIAISFTFLMNQVSSASYPGKSFSSEFLYFLARSVIYFGRRNDANTGTSVSETRSDARSAIIYAVPIGARSLPSTHGRRRSGTNTRATRIVAYTIELRTSLDDSKTTFSEEIC